MRVLYMHQYFNTLSDTGGTRSYEMARRLVAGGHTVHMITSKRADPDSEASGWVQSEEAGIQVHWVSVPYSNSMSYKNRIRAFLRFAWLAAGKAASLEGDVVFATSTPLTIALPAVYAARKGKIPMVLEVRDLWPEVPIAVGALRGPLVIGATRWLERFAYRNSAQIVALSPGMKAGVVRSGYPAEKVHVIPNASDLDLFDVSPEVGRRFRARLDWLQERPLVVYTGALGFANGVGYLARVAAALRQLDPEVRFLVVGSGKEEERIRSLASELGIIDRNFFMVKSLPKSEIPAVLSAADMATSLFIDLPEMWNNSANKFFDALASGTPIAINYRGWQAELLNQSGAGLVLDPGNVGSAARQLAQSLRDRAWLERAGRAARRLAEERFSRDKLAARLEQVLCEVMVGRNALSHPQA